MFVLFTNDLQPLDHIRAKVIKFADDQTWTFKTSRLDSDITQTELDMLSSWCALNKMFLNPRKTKEMIVTNRKTLPVVPDARICGETIERVDQVTVLGLQLSNNLKWHTLANTKVSKLNSLFHAFKHLSFTHPEEDLKLLFQAVLVPSVMYGCPAWCNIGAGELQRIQVALNRSAKIAGVAFDIKEHIDYNILSLFKLSQNPKHMLHSIIPPLTNTRISRRPRIPSVKTNSQRFFSHFVPTGVRLNAANS